MSHLYILYQTQVKSYRNVIVTHILTGKIQINVAVVNYIIGSSVVVDADLRTVLLVWMDHSSHHLTATSIVDGGGIGHMLNVSVSVVRWMNFVSGCKDGYRPWVFEDTSKTARDSFCDDEN